MDQLIEPQNQKTSNKISIKYGHMYVFVNLKFRLEYLKWP